MLAVPLIKVGGMQDSIMEHFWSTSHISGGNAAYVEELYDKYLHDANSVPEEWRNYFEQLPRVGGVVTQDTPHSVIRAQFEQLGKSRPRAAAATTTAAGTASLEHQR